MLRLKIEIFALKKVKSRGDIIIRVNLADLQLATAHKEDFIKRLEISKSIQIIEDSSVDRGGCIIETDFGEIDARIASQLAELESKILEISPITSSAKETPVPVVKDTYVKSVLSATSTMLDLNRKKPEQQDFISDDIEAELGSDEEVSQGVNAALAASAALTALATMAQKGKRDADKKMANTLESLSTKGLTN